MSFINKFSKQDLLFICVIAVIVVVSSLRLTTFPRVFYDEGITIEIARNFEQFGVLDITTAPGKFSDIPYKNGTNGFTVTLPLAMVFKLFGFGLIQARIYALICLILALNAIYIFAKRFWGDTHALSAVLLIATFAPVYDTGRRVLGEVPGFFFFVVGLYMLMILKKPMIAGIFLGLATVSKPSVFLLVSPSLLLAALFINYDLRKKIIPIAIGICPAIILWILLAFPDPLSLNTWQGVLDFYRNPFASSSILGDITRNIQLFLSQTTLMYFSLIVIFIGWVTFLRRQSVRQDLYLSFLIPYGIFMVIYFLKSPGWLKYLIPLELLILMILPVYIQSALTKFNKAKYYVAVILFLTVLQGVQLIFFSNITSASSASQNITDYLSKKSGMVGVINSPQIASFIPPERELQYLTINAGAISGHNPLDLPQKELPRFIVMPTGYEDSELLSAEQKNSLKYYKLITSDDWNVYELK